MRILIPETENPTSRFVHDTNKIKIIEALLIDGEARIQRSSIAKQCHLSDPKLILSFRHKRFDWLVKVKHHVNNIPLY